MKTWKDRRAEAVQLVTAMLKWMIVGGLIGAIGGVIGTAFHMGVDYATELRHEHGWILYLLPVAGVVITALYRVTKTEGLGTNAIIESVNFALQNPNTAPPQTARESTILEPLT